MDVSAAAGQASSSVQVRADGTDRVKLDASTFHFLQRGNSSVGLTVNISQSLLPSVSDLHLNMAANTSSDKCVYLSSELIILLRPAVKFPSSPVAASVSLRGFYQHGEETLLVQVQGSLKSSQSLQVAVRGDLRHSLAAVPHLPPALGLEAALKQSDTFTDGNASDLYRCVFP